MERTGRPFIQATGFPPEVRRGVLRNLFNVNEAITKIYVPASLKFAKIYYKSDRQLQEAFAQLRDDPPFGCALKILRDNRVEGTSLSENGESGDMDNTNFPEVYHTDAEYVDIHGNHLNVLESDDGEKYIALTEIRKAGFAIFLKEKYDRYLISKQLALKDFQSYMMGAAKKYIIEHVATQITHQDIEKTIKWCETELLKVTNATSPERNLKNETLPASTPKNDDGIIKKFVNNDKENNSFNHNSNDTQLNTDSRTKNSNLRTPRVEKAEFDSGKPSLLNDKKNSFTNDNNRNKTSENFRQSNNMLNNFGSSDSLNGNKKVSNFKGPRPESKNNRNGINKYKNTITLSKDPQLIKVVHIEKENIFWAQLQSNEEIVLKILEDSVEGVVENEKITPIIGSLYLVEYEGMWSRGYVQKAVGESFAVHFIDFGNSEVVAKEQFRSLPLGLEEIPGQAVRTTVSNQHEIEIEEEGILNVKLHKLFDDGTCLVNPVGAPNAQGAKNLDFVRKNPSNESLQKANETKQAPKQKKFFDTLSYKPLVDKEKVMIINESNGRLYLRNKELHDLCKKVSEAIKSSSTEPIEDCVQGQMVLCKNDKNVLCRAKIESVKENVATVKLIDYNEIKDVDVSSLSNVTEEISQIPCALIETPILKGLDENKLSDEGKRMLQNFIDKSSKFVADLNERYFDLKFDNKSLSSVLFPAKEILPDIKLVPAKSLDKLEVAPASVQTSSKVKSVDVKVKPEVASTPIKTPPKVDFVKEKPASAEIPEPTTPPLDIPTFNSMKTLPVVLGLRECIITSFDSLNDFTVTCLSEDVTDLMAKVYTIQTADENPYQAQEDEVVLGLYGDSWYRCTVTAISTEGMYDVIYIDCGNFDTLTKNQIRKLPEDLWDVPMLGLNCRLEGFPDTEEVKQKLKGILVPDAVLNLDVTAYDKDMLQCTVQIPDIENVLQC